MRIEDHIINFKNFCRYFILIYVSEQGEYLVVN